jgi:hypothetical protein
MRFMPSARAALIVAALSLGFAMKNVPIGSERPAVGPEAHVLPVESVRAAGTKTA